MGRTTGTDIYIIYSGKAFQSTPSVGRTTQANAKSKQNQKISIHALRGEDDTAEADKVSRKRISIHALRGEDDFNSSFQVFKVLSFQSTPSVGRTTEENQQYRINVKFQSTPSVGRTTSTK